MKPLSRQHKNDLILLGILLMIAVFSLILITVCKQDGAIIQIVRDKTVISTYSLEQDQTVELSDASGNNTLVIQNGMAYIQNADCPDKLCVHQNPISHQGETLVCLPHKLVIQVVSGEEGEVDLAT